MNFISMNFRSICILCIFCTSFNLTQAQHHNIFIVLDSISGEKIPFATVNIKNKGIYFEADSSGQFRYLHEKGDTILISCVGYFNKLVIGLESETSQIKLLQKPKELGSVYVGKYQIIQAGIFDTRVAFSMAPSLSDRTEFATLINVPPDVNKYEIQSIYFKVYTKHAKSGAVNPVRIHVYKVNNDGTPGDDMLQNDIVLTSLRLEGKYLIVDLPEENIIMTDRSFFISMQWINQQTQTKNYKQPQISLTENATMQMTWFRQTNINNYSWFKRRSLKYWINMIVKADLKVYEKSK